MGHSSKIVAIVGATGAHGGSLVRAILQDAQRKFRARALTRDPKSDRSRALAELGVDVVRADPDDVTSLKRAFAGAWGAYCATNFHEHLSPEKELSQARHMAEAAWHADLEHVIWSTCEDTRESISLHDMRMPTLMRRYKVPQFDAKGQADAEFSSREVPVTFLRTSFDWEELVHVGTGPVRTADGELVLALPIADKALPGIAVADIGRCAHGIFASGTEYVGQSVGIAGEHLTGNELAAGLSEALGEPVRYDAISPAAYRALGFPGADILGNMFQYIAEFSRAFRGARSVEQSRKLNPQLLTFRTWIAVNRDRIRLDSALA